MITLTKLTPIELGYTLLCIPRSRQSSKHIVCTQYVVDKRKKYFKLKNKVGLDHIP